jgi:hypothetical protein
MVRHIDGNLIVYDGKGMDFDAIAQKGNVLINPDLLRLNEKRQIIEVATPARISDHDHRSSLFPIQFAEGSFIGQFHYQLATRARG